jgi:ATP-dependent 26S proteasome regulatory subunit
LDEVDAIAATRGSDGTNANTVALLNNLDKLSAESGVFIIATTNRPEANDTAFTRSGRLDQKALVDLPSIVDKSKILELYLKPFKISEKLSVSVFASQLNNYSGADIRRLVDLAVDKQMDIDACQNLASVMIQPETLQVAKTEIDSMRDTLD